MASTTIPASRVALLWQRFLLTLCALGIAAIAVNILSGSIMSDSERGFQVGGMSQAAPFTALVTYVAPGGAGERSGLRAGDAIDLLQLSPVDRYRIVNGVTPGEPLNIPVSRGKQRLTIHYTGGYVPIRWDVWLGLAGTIWAVLVGALLIWRRPEEAEARLLCLLLLGISVPSFFVGGDWASTAPGLDIIVNTSGKTLNFLSIPLLATYASLFARPPSKVRRILLWISYALAIVASVMTVWGQVAFLTGSVQPGVAVIDSSLFSIVLYGGLFLVPLLCLLETARVAVNPERDRILWTSVTIGVYYAWSALFFMVQIALPAITTTPLLRSEQMVADILILLMPIGMAYALLNRRVLDVGFALNRAVVFSGVSIIVVGAFVLVEWLVSEWLRSAGHTENLAFGAGIALALGFSIRFVHGKVDYFVDHLFFRTRRENEEAIHDMARQAPYITDRAILLQRMEVTLSENADASYVTILSRDESGSYGGFDENDPAIVALRAYHKVVDLHAVATAIAGEWAYPMIARGELIAVLTLGAKRSGESYAPDESAVIAELAASAAAALDVLSLQGRAQPEAALERIEALLVNVLHRLPRLPDGG